MSEGLLFRWLGVKFYRTSTPFLGSVILGSLTATLATLGDVSWLLLTGAGGKIAFDLTICTSALLVHYGVGLPQCSSALEAGEENNLNSGTSGLAAAGSKASGRRRRLQRRRRKRHKWVTTYLSNSDWSTLRIANEIFLPMYWRTLYQKSNFCPRILFWQKFTFRHISIFAPKLEVFFFLFSSLKSRFWHKLNYKPIFEKFLGFEFLEKKCGFGIVCSA